MHYISLIDSSRQGGVAWFLDAGSAGQEMFTVLGRMLTVANEDSRNQPPPFDYVEVRAPTEGDCDRYPATCR